MIDVSCRGLSHIHIPVGHGDPTKLLATFRSPMELFAISGELGDLAAEAGRG
jgi:hypothetical protein